MPAGKQNNSKQESHETTHFVGLLQRLNEVMYVIKVLQSSSGIYAMVSTISTRKGTPTI